VWSYSISLALHYTHTPYNNIHIYTPYNSISLAIHYTTTISLNAHFSTPVIYTVYESLGAKFYAASIIKVILHQRLDSLPNGSPVNLMPRLCQRKILLQHSHSCGETNEPPQPMPARKICACFSQTWRNRWRWWTALLKHDSIVYYQRCNEYHLCRVRVYESEYCKAGLEYKSSRKYRVRVQVQQIQNEGQEASMIINGEPLGG